MSAVTVVASNSLSAVTVVASNSLSAVTVVASNSLSAVHPIAIICSLMNPLMELRAYFKSVEADLRDPSAWVLKTCKKEIETHLCLN